ncbi:MAG: THUMP domain-containing protein, partial [Muribaculaceae bacterium]
MKEKFEMVAKTFQGLEGVLAEELKVLEADDVEIGRRMVSFKGDLKMLYKANFCCRTALRILKPIYKFRATDADALYEAIKLFDWESVLKLDQTFSIDSTVYSEEFRHSKFVTYRVKDAIADFFNDKYGKRPSIRINNADIMFNVHISEDQVTLSLDSSGEPLYKRGYRVAQTEAPINEVLAAGLIKLSGWNGDSNLIDPMCGSGTFLIEAALIGANINPGVYREGFAFERWRDYDAELFDSIYNDDSNEQEFKFKIYGSDISPKAVDVAESNIKRAGVSKYVDLRICNFQSITEAPEKGILITNPPYGERIAVEDMGALYKSIGEKLKKVFQGYHAWIIGYKDELFDEISLKPSIKYPILNGALECEFREYVIFDGAYNQFRSEGGSVKNDNFKRPERTIRKTRFDESIPPRLDTRKEGGFGDRKFGDRDAKRDGGFGGERKFGDRKFGDRDVKRDGGFGGERKFGDRKFGDRDTKREGGFGGERKFGDRKFGDRDAKREGGFG